MSNMIKVLSLMVLLSGCGSITNTTMTIPTPVLVQGPAGAPGYNSLITIMHSSTSCPNGGITLLAGLDVNRNSKLDIQEISQSTEVCNGTNGLNGTNGTNGTNGIPGKDGQDAVYTPVTVIYPCGQKQYSEAFIRLDSGTIIASFSDNFSGNNTRLSVLTPGHYITTDGYSCNFTVNSDGSITY